MEGEHNHKEVFFVSLIDAEPRAQVKLLQIFNGIGIKISRAPDVFPGEELLYPL